MGIYLVSWKMCCPFERAGIQWHQNQQRQCEIRQLNLAWKLKRARSSLRLDSRAEYNERCSFSWNVGSKRCHKYLYNNLNRHIQDFWYWSANSDARPGSVECVKRRKKRVEERSQKFFFILHISHRSHTERTEESSIEAIAISDQHCRSDFTSPLLEWNKKTLLRWEKIVILC